jgi:peroxiredoxin
VEEIPDMMALNRLFEGRPFQMLAVSVNTQWSGVDQFYEEHGFDLPTLLDPGRQASGDYRVFAFPETFLIDGQGVIARKFVGARKWTDPAVVQEVDRLVRSEEHRAFGINSATAP